MNNDDAKKDHEVLIDDDAKMARGLTRREFVKYSVGTVACLYLGVLTSGCGGGRANYAGVQVVRWPIAKDVFTTVQQQVLPVPVSACAAAPPASPGTSTFKPPPLHPMRTQCWILAVTAACLSLAAALSFGPPGSWR